LRCCGRIWNKRAPIFGRQPKRVRLCCAEANAALLRNEFEARLQGMAKELVKWFAGILFAHGIAVIGVTVTLVKLL
jgi:hypothetical protein